MPRSVALPPVSCSYRDRNVSQDITGIAQEPVKRGTPHAEDPGGFGLVAPRSLQGSTHGIGIEFPIRSASRPLIFELHRQVSRADHATFGLEQRKVDGVLQLSHIPRPRVIEHDPERILRNAGAFLTVFGGLL